MEKDNGVSSSIYFQRIASRLNLILNTIISAICVYIFFDCCYCDSVNCLLTMLDYMQKSGAVCASASQCM